MRTILKAMLFSTVAALSLGATLAWGDPNLGIFSGQCDVGNTAKPGSAGYDPATGEYTISGGGANMWFTNDAFHFVWVKMSGDFTLAADVKFLGTNTQPHRKACLLIRQSLAPGSAYADVALHGNGMTALQSRESDGDTTREIQSNFSAPGRVRLEKHGNHVYMCVTPDGLNVKLLAQEMYDVSFNEPFYVGLGVCAHNNAAIEHAVFSDVELKSVPPVTTNDATMTSTLETLEIASTDRQVVLQTLDHIEAPNWSPDGSYFLFNSKGRILKLPTNGIPELLDTGSQTNCNNDHGLSPDGQWLAISDQSRDGKSRIYVLPSSGGEPRLMTKLAPSYWHGWSPDGKTLAYCAERNGNFDIYSIPAKGGKEKRLTTAEGLDDGPDYSSDGKYIYFNSERTGLMQIWRMKPDGSDQEQITTDDYNNWFAHPSPNGRWIVFLSYNKDVKGHPPGQDVMLRLMSLTDRRVQVLAKLYGGQGTINVPSWSPDNKNIAFVSYQLLYPR
jgi:WD40 repeat protein